VHLRYKASLNYTFTESENADGDFVPEISKHCFNASFTYAFNDDIILNLRANYVGERENPKLITSTNSMYIDPYLIFNATLSCLNFRGFKVQIIGQNIFNKEYYHTSNRPPDRYRQAQRTLMLSVGYSLAN
jgi:outer membrane receptor for monomeric catechols